MVNGIDAISLIAWGSGAVMGLVGGLMRMWLPVLFLLAGMGFAGGLADPVGSSLFAFIDTEAGQTVAGFFLVFVPILAAGGFITLILFAPLSIMSRLMGVFPLGSTFNRYGGVLLGTLFGCVFLSIFLIGLHQYPVESVAEAIDDSSFAASVIGLVDQYVAALEFSAK